MKTYYGFWGFENSSNIQAIKDTNKGRLRRLLKKIARGNKFKESQRCNYLIYHNEDIIRHQEGGVLIGNKWYVSEICFPHAGR